MGGTAVVEVVLFSSSECQPLDARNGGFLRWLCDFHKGRSIPSSTNADQSLRSGRVMNR